MTDLNSFLKKAEELKHKSTVRREQNRPLYEEAQAALAELTRLQNKRLKAGDVIAAYKAGDDSITDEAYQKAKESIDDLDIQIQRVQTLADNRRTRANNAGREAAYADIGEQNRLADEFAQWQAEQKRQFWDKINR